MNAKHTLTVICSVVFSFSTYAGPKVLPLALGATNSGTIALPGQHDRFTFNGSVGQRLYYDALDLDYENINVGLYTPSGALIPNFPRNQSSDAGPFFLPETGTYSVLVNGVGDAVGNYNFRFLDAGNGTLVGYGTNVTGQLNPQSATVAYRFNGAPGQRLSVTNISASSGNGSWRLLGQDDQTFFNQNIGTTPAEIVLPVTGSYLLLVEGAVDSIGVLDYVFRINLISNPSGGTSGFGTIRSGTTTAGQTNLFTYTAPAGTVVFFDALTNTTPAIICLYDPADEQVPGFCVGGTSDVGPFVLPRSGNYRLEVVGYGDGPFNFRLLDGGAAPAITFGATNAQTITAPFRTDLHRFTGSVGQRLHYDALDPDYDAVTVRIVQPNGGIVFINGNASYDLGPFTITQPGTYYLLMESYADDPTLDYSFRLLDMAQSPVAVLTFGATVNGVLDPGTRTDWYRFSGTAGQRVYFDGAETNTAGSFVLFGPQDQGLSGNSLAADFEHLLLQTGTYLVAAFHNAGDTNALPYSFRTVLGTSTTNTLTLGTVVTGAVAQVGQEFHYTFTGAAGQRLHYDALDADADSLRVFLMNPNGGGVWIDGNAESDVGSFTLAESGIYTLVIRGYGIATGTYRFRLIDMSLPPVQTLALNTTVNGVLAPGTEVDWYRINGTAGQRLYFVGADTNTGGSWSFYGPDNGGLNGNSLQSEFEHVLPVTGTYLLSVYQSGNTNPLPYSIRVSVPTTTVVPLAFGTGYTNAIAAAGEEHRYTFTGTAGQRLFYDALEADFDSMSVQLLDPAGNVVHISHNADNDVGLFTLLHSGAYTLVLRGSGETTGDYRFKLLDLAAAPAITYGTTVTAQLSPQIETDLYRINGTAGQRLLITNLAASSGNANWSLIGLDNGNLWAQNIQNSLGEIVLPVTGTYALSIVGSADLIGTLDYQFQVSLLSSSNGTPAGFGVTYGGTTTFAQTNAYAYVGTAGLPVYFDNLTNGSAALFQLVAPDGTLVFNFNSSSDSGPYFLPTNGAYTLNVIGVTDGAFRFQLVDLTSSSVSNLVFGATHRNTMSPGFRTDIYRFTGTAEQRLLYDGLDYQFEGITVRLFDPIGGNSFLYHNSDADVGPLTLSLSGTYYLTLESYTADPAVDYGFRLLDAAQAPATTLVLDTQIDGTLDPGTRFDLYRLNGTAGQRLYFDGMPTNTVPLWYLYGPQNQQLGGAALSGDFEVTLPQTGPYLLIVGFGTDTNPAPYSVRVVTPTDTTNALTIGATFNGVLNEPGELDYYTFTGTAGQQLYYDALQYDYEAINVRLIDPVGGVVFDHNTDAEGAPITLAFSGTYLARIYSGNTTTGSYSFRFLDAAAAPLVAYNTVLTNNLTNFHAALYRVPITPGLRLYFDNLAAPDGNGSQLLYDFDNVLLVGTYAGNDFETTPTLAGAHLLILNPVVVSTPIPYSVQIIPGNHTPVLSAIGNRVINEESNFTFTATATDVELPNDVLTWSLDAGAPAGATINPVTGVFSWTPTEVQGSNTYTVTVRVRDDGIPLFDDSETFTITVNEVNKPPTLQLPPTQTIDELTALNVTIGGNDLDVPTNTLTFALLSGPSGLTVSPAGVVSWTPLENQGPGTHPVTVRVFDNNPLAVNAQSLSATGTFNVVVNEINVPPTFTGPGNLTLVEETPLNATATATDSDDPANPLTFALISGPSGLTVAANGVILWTPTEAQGSNIHSVSIRVTDNNVNAVNPQQLSATNTFTIIVLESNKPPALTVPGTQTILEETPLTASASATDPDSPANPLTFSLVSPPAGLTINAASGAFSWTPTEAQGSNSYAITVVVTDTNVSAFNERFISVTNTFTIIVNESNRPPTLQLPATQTIDELTILNVTIGANDLDVPTNTLTFALLSGPSGLTVSPAGVVNWTPLENQGPGTHPVTVRVFDNNPLAVNAQSLSATGTFNVVVNEINVPPTFTGPGNLTLVEETPLNATATATDSDDPTNPLTFALISGPSGLAVAANGMISWTPTEFQGSNSYAVSIRVTDNNINAVNTQQLSATNNFTITVLESNKPPALTVPGTQTIVEETPLSASASATDPDSPANPLTFSLVSAPVGLTINAASGALSWTPTEAQGSNSYVITVVVTDTNVTAFNARAISVTNTFTVIVNESNRPPALTVPGTQTIVEETPLSASASATDPDSPANPLTFSLVSAPVGLTINAASGALSWTPTEAQGSNSYVITVVVTDTNLMAFNARSISVTNTFTVIVNESNRPPVLNSPGTQTVTEETPLNVTVTATDPDLPVNTLTFGLVAPPAGLTINSSSGAISWTPTEAQGPSNHVITVTVTDTNPPAVNTKSFTVTNTFTVNVFESNKPPVLTLPSNQTVPELVALSLSATATDPDQPTNTLTIALVSGPAGLNVSAGGAITWTPSEAQGPSNYVVTVRVTDNGAPSLSVTQSFQITVQEMNVAPTLAAIPGRAVHVGTLVSLTANANDTDAPTNQLAFSLVSPPSGATIGASSGIFSWTPTNQLGTTTVQVRVADDGSPSLSATQTFNVRVEPPPLLSPLVLSNSNAHLAWTAITNLIYRAQYKSDLVVSNWSNLAGDVTATSTNTAKVDTNAGANTNRFYRVLVVP